MESFFNEISIQNKMNECSITDEELIKLPKLYSTFKSAGINTCRIDQKTFKELQIALKKQKYNNADMFGLLYTFFQIPYENAAVDKQADEYLCHVWKYNDMDCYGLALAYIMDSISVSLGNKEEWGHSYIRIYKDSDETFVRNAFSYDQLVEHTNWLESLKEEQLVPSELNSKEKKVNLRHDHGEDELKRFADRIVFCPYVCEVINSLPFNRNNRRFIHRIKPNGIIEIVLPWTDEGIGLAVRTTGRNLRETEEIARILKEEYGKG